MVHRAISASDLTSGSGFVDFSSTKPDRESLYISLTQSLRAECEHARRIDTAAQEKAHWHLAFEACMHGASQRIAQLILPVTPRPSAGLGVIVHELQIPVAVDSRC